MSYRFGNILYLVCQRRMLGIAWHIFFPGGFGRRWQLFLHASQHIFANSARLFLRLCFTLQV